MIFWLKCRFPPNVSVIFAVFHQKYGKTRYNEPNELTRNAIEEAMSGQSAGTLDMSSFEAFMESVNEFE